MSMWNVYINDWSQCDYTLVKRSLKRFEMNKYNVIFALGLYIPIVFCMSDEMKELAAMLHNTCVEETGVDEVLIDNANNKKIWSDDEKFKCYVKCLMAQMACIDDEGVVDVEATIAVLPEEMKAEAGPMMRGCGAKIGANPCESAWLTHKCYIETNPKAYFII